MSCEVIALPFEAHANYGTWSIDFVSNIEIAILEKNNNWMAPKLFRTNIKSADCTYMFLIYYNLVQRLQCYSQWDK